MDLLKLVALDRDDLTVISMHLQDAIVRVGDIGLAVALMIMFATFGSVSFAGVFGPANEASEATLTALGFMLLLAACGLIGLITGQYAWALAIGLGAYLLWHLKQLLRLHAWLPAPWWSIR